jgi:serine/threonine-protein kinase
MRVTLRHLTEVLQGATGAAALVAAAWMAVPTAARAAQAQAAASEAAAAQALFDEGRALLAQRRFAEACGKLAESQRMAPAMGTAFNLAECYAQIGKPASAWSLYRDVEADAQLSGQEARAALARARADELEPTLPRLLVHVAQPSPGLEVRRDGLAIGAAQWEVAVPVDLGEHAVSASAPGRRAWHETVRITRSNERASVTVPALERDLGPAVAASPAATPPARAPAIGDGGAEPAVDRGRAGQRAAIGFAAAGLAFAIAAGVTTAVAVRQYQSASPCDGTVCYNSDAVTARAHARTLGNVATGLGIAGAVGLATGAALWLTAPRPATAGDSRARAWWRVGVFAGGVAASGAW